MKQPAKMDRRIKCPKWYWIGVLVVVCALLGLVLLFNRERLNSYFISKSWSNFNSAEERKMSENVWLHRTSGRDVGITDRHGFGLVAGNIVKAGYDKSDPDLFIIAFSANRLFVVSLRSGEVKTLADPDGLIFRSLKDISGFI